MSRLLTRGHDAAAAAIRSMIAGSPPHAIVITGPAGVGKTTLALDLAAGLLCDAPDPADRPCRECRGCRLVEHGSHADLHRLAPAGAGNQIRIGERDEPEPGTVRRLISDLALLPVEGGARVALDREGGPPERGRPVGAPQDPRGAARRGDDHPLRRPGGSAPADRPIALRPAPARAGGDPRDRGDPGRRRRWPTRQPPPGSRASPVGGPGSRRIWALAPEAVTARAEIARSLLDLAGAGAARRLSVGRELLARAGELVRILDRAANRSGGGRRPAKRARKGGRAAAPARRPLGYDVGGRGRRRDATTPTPTSPRFARPGLRPRNAAAPRPSPSRSGATSPATSCSSGSARSAASAIPALLDDLRGSTDLTAARLGPFLARLDRSAELIDANVSPELALDVLLLAWPRPRRCRLNGRAPPPRGRRPRPRPGRRLPLLRRPGGAPARAGRVGRERAGRLRSSRRGGLRTRTRPDRAPARGPGRRAPSSRACPPSGCRAPARSTASWCARVTTGATERAVHGVDHRTRGSERVRYSLWSIPGAPWIVMETRGSPAQGAIAVEAASTPADDLPGLYRDILDRVADSGADRRASAGGPDPHGSDAGVFGGLGRGRPGPAPRADRPRRPNDRRPRSAAWLDAPAEVGARALVFGRAARRVQPRHPGNHRCRDRRRPRDARCPRDTR